MESSPYISEQKKWIKPGHISVAILSAIILCSCDSSPDSKTNDEELATNVVIDAEMNSESADAGVTNDSDAFIQPAPAPAHGRILAGVSTRGHADGTGNEARFDGVTCVAASGQWLWLSDTFNGTVRRIDIESGDTTTMVGRPYEFAVVDGGAEEARFESPRGCTLTDVNHPLGPAFWVADGPALRKVSLNDSLTEVIDVSTVIGRAGERGNRDGIGSEARLGYLTHHIVPSPNSALLYLADRSNGALRTVSINQEGNFVLSTVQRGFDSLGGLTWSEDGILIANTFAGELVHYHPDEDTLTVVADDLGQPQGLCTNGQSVWLAGFEGVITQLDLNSGERSILAGVEGETDALDGIASKARLGGAFASLICDLERERILYVDNHTGSLRSVSMESGYVSTLSGASNPSLRRDGANQSARFGLLSDIVGVLTSEGDMSALPTAKWYVADPMHRAVRFIDEKEGMTRTLFNGNSRSSRLVDGPLESATAVMPVGLAYDEQTNSLYVSDAGAHVIRRVDLNQGEVITIAGQAGQTGLQDGFATEVLFDEPLGLSFDQGILYIVDGVNGVIRSLDLSTGEVKTISEAIQGLFDVEVGQDGWLYATNEVNATLERLTPRLSSLRASNELGRWEVVAGERNVTGPADGPRGLLARPLGLTKGADGQLLIADAGNHRIRSYSLSDGRLDTFVGHASRRGSVTGESEFVWDDLTLYDPYASIWLGSGRGAIVYEGAVMGLWNPEEVPPAAEPLPPPPSLNDLPSGDFEVVLKRGQRGEDSLMPRDILTLHRGCQGAQHAWVGLEVSEVNEEPIALRMLLIDSEQEVASLYLEGEPWMMSDPIGYELLGLTFVIYDPSEVLDRELMMGVEVTLPNGQVGYGWCPVTVQWGEDACGG